MYCNTNYIHTYIYVFSSCLQNLFCLCAYVLSVYSVLHVLKEEGQKEGGRMHYCLEIENGRNYLFCKKGQC